MTRLSRLLAPVAALAWLAAGGASAYNPGTDSRAGATADTSGSTTICEGGSEPPSTPCESSADCTAGGLCRGIADVQVVARGELTIIADTQTPGMGWASTSTAPTVCSEPAEGVPSDCETEDNALLTLLLEFTLNGQRYAWAESFKQLPDAAIPNWSIGGGSQAGWVQPAVESILSERAAVTTQVVAIRWGGVSPAAESAIGAVVGKSPTQRIALSRVDEVPICTAAAACNHGPRNTRFSDHSGATDVLGTVRRYKVDIAVVGP